MKIKTFCSLTLLPTLILLLWLLSSMNYHSLDNNAYGQQLMDFINKDSYQITVYDVINKDHVTEAKITTFSSSIIQS